MAALERTIALAEMDHVALRIGDNLELDVAGLFKILLQVHLARAERGLALGASEREQARQLACVAHDPHPLAAAARRRFDQHRITDRLGVRLRIAQLRDAGAFAARQHRHAGALHDPARARLIAHQADMAGARPDEPQSGAMAGFGEIAVLGQEAVARMDRVGAVGNRGAQDRRDVEIAVLGRRRADTNRLVCHPHVQRLLIGSRIDGDRRDS